MKLRTYLAFKLTLIALCGIAGFAAVRYYIWMPLSAATCAAAWFVMRKPFNRRLLVGSFVAIGLFGLAVGRLYFNGTGLDENGLFLMLFALPPAGIVALYILSSETQAGEEENAPLA